jgi:magnesium transporter
MKLFNKKYHSPGTQPGVIKTVNETHCVVSFTHFNKVQSNTETSTDLNQIEALQAFVESDQTVWIHSQGEPSNELLGALSKRFNIKELFAEDIVNVGQRPKVEISDDQIFVILNLPLENDGSTKIEQVCLFLTRNTILSFCTGLYNPFGKVSSRLQLATGQLRKHPADYLMYALIDTVIDFGFPLLESYSQRIENLEDDLLVTSDKGKLTQVHQLRRELLLVRRRLWPQREAINELLRNEECELLSRNTIVHLKDCHDHVLSIMEMLETYHEMTSGLMELYMTTVSMKLNDVMKFLTVFTTIFIPPTLLVGIYGMNFNPSASPLNMPELNWEYGYIVVWAAIAIMVTSMLAFFKKKHWI